MRISKAPLANDAPLATREQLRHIVAPVEMPFNPLTLRFYNAQHDADFSMHVCQKMLQVVRITLLLGCLIYASFGILDALVAPDELQRTLSIRFGIVCPIILAVFMLSMHKSFKKYSQAFLSILTICACLGIILISTTKNEFIINNYFSGLIIVIFYCSNLTYIRFSNVLPIIISINIIYFLIAIYVNRLDHENLYSQLFFIISGSSLSLYCCYAQEYFLIKDYINNFNIRKTASHIEDLYIKANAANHAKSEFLTIMSHELRTPLNAVIGFSDLIAGEMLGPLQNAKYKEYAVDINNSGKHLLSIINDILDLTRAETGKLQLSENDFSLAETLHITLNMMVGKAGEKGVRLALDSPASTLIVHADERLLKQAVINLLSNAIKFTDGGKQVIVSYAQKPDGALEISVTDEGIGIAPEHMDRVLEPFVQVENSFTRVNDGIGIGLPLVRRIIELHDGRMTIQSSVGLGTTVTLQLPAERVLSYTHSAEALTASATQESQHDQMAQ